MAARPTGCAVSGRPVLKTLVPRRPVLEMLVGAELLLMGLVPVAAVKTRIVELRIFFVLIVGIVIVVRVTGAGVRLKIWIVRIWVAPEGIFVVGIRIRRILILG